jgi:hypothetical protein
VCAKAKPKFLELIIKLFFESAILSSSLARLFREFLEHCRICRRRKSELMRDLRMHACAFIGAWTDEFFLIVGHTK